MMRTVCIMGTVYEHYMQTPGYKQTSDGDKGLYTFTASTITNGHGTAWASNCLAINAVSI